MSHSLDQLIELTSPGPAPCASIVHTITTISSTQQENRVNGTEAHVFNKRLRFFVPATQIVPCHGQILQTDFQ